METILTVAQMRQSDAAAIAREGTGRELMARAGAGVFAAGDARRGQRRERAAGPEGGGCGPGPGGRGGKQPGTEGPAAGPGWGHAKIGGGDD